MSFLTGFAKSQLTAKATRDFEAGYSMAGSVYKFAEEHFDYEVAEQAQQFYCDVQRQLVIKQQLEGEALELAYEQHLYENGVEM